MEELLHLLEEKEQLMLQYEQITDSMYIVPTEEIERCIGKRQSIIQKVDILGERIQALLTELPPEATAAERNQCDREGLTVELGTIYDAAQRIRAIACRIQGNTEGIRERIEWERDDAQNKLEELERNRVTVNLAGKYGKGVQTGLGVDYQTHNSHELKI